MTIGIIIINYNTYEKTISCINSILEKSTANYEIYVVDNCSKDDSFDKLNIAFNKYERIKIIEATSNGGYSAGVNIGIKAAQMDNVDTILIMNSDVYLVNDAVSLMYEALVSSDKLSIVGPAIKLKDSSYGQLARGKLTYRKYIFSKKPLYFFSIYMKSKFQRNIEINHESNIFEFNGMVSGCCFMVKSSVIDKIGLLDENVFLYFEEDILSYKLDCYNLTTAIVNQAYVIHDHSSSISKNGSAFERYHRYISSLYVLRAYAGVNNIKYIVACLINIIPYIYNSLFNKKYRALLYNFIKKCKKIMNYEPGIMSKNYKEEQ